MSRVRQFVLAGGLALFAAACTDTADTPSGPASPNEAMLQLQASPSQEDLDRVVPGFGGFYYDDQDRPTVFLTAAGDRGRAEQALGRELAGRGLGARDLQVRRGEYTWRDLNRWFGLVSTAALTPDGAAWVDADETSNRVRIGISDLSAMARVRAAVARTGVPAEATVFEVTERIKPMLGLRDVVNPKVGGIQINFPGFLCTMGFNVTAGTNGGFITNSHCTNVQGGVENTPYWQPLESVAPTQIATEVADPAYTTGGACPAGSVCRNSDASRAAYASGVSWSLGQLARTGSSKNGSLEIVGTWTITAAEDASSSFPINTVLNKVGRTTGWSQGKVSNTCVNTGVSGTNIVQFCQTFVRAKVNSGDSGSPVFQITSGTNVKLVGILWGGGGGSFVFSPLRNIELDLGNLTVH